MRHRVLIDRLVQRRKLSFEQARMQDERLTRIEDAAMNGSISAHNLYEQELSLLEQMVMERSRTDRLPSWDELRFMVESGQISINRGREIASLMQDEERHWGQSPILRTVDKSTVDGSYSTYAAVPPGDLLDPELQKFGPVYSKSYTFDPNVVMRDPSDPNIAQYPREEIAMTSIAKVSSRYDYSGDTGFMLPPIDDAMKASVMRGGSPFPNTYSLNRPDLTRHKPFKDLVYKAWGKNVLGVDPSKSGGYTLLGDGWIDSRSNASISNSKNVLPGAPDVYGALDFPLVSQTWAEFSDETLDREAIVLSVSHGHQTVAILLLNRQIAENKDIEGEEVLFAPHTKFSVLLPGVEIPFPFNQDGDHNSRFKYYNTAEVTMDIEVNSHYGVVLIGKTDFRSKTSSIKFYPETNEHVIPGSVQLQVAGRNVFNAVADVLWYLRENGYIKLDGDTVRKTVKAHGARNEFLVSALNGSEIIKPEKKFVPPTIKAPHGLPELPLCPNGYHFIGDAGGQIFLTDKHGQRLLLPYEVFDLEKLITSVENTEADLAKKGLQPNVAVLQMRQQIEAIRALFRHQADLLEGKSFTYNALASIDWTVPSPFRDEDDGDDL